MNTNLPGQAPLQQQDRLVCAMNSMMADFARAIGVVPPEAIVSVLDEIKRIGHPSGRVARVEAVLEAALVLRRELDLAAADVAALN